MKVLTVHDVARYFLARQDPVTEQITPKKLQKLVYLAHGYTLALLHRPLWDTEKIGARLTAWEQGPVVPDLWREYNKAQWRVLPIPSNVDFESFDPALRAMMDEVLAKYGHLSADELANLTHHHDPYVSAWGKVEGAISKPLGFDLISEPEVAEYFTRMLSGTMDARHMTPKELSDALRAKPEWADEDARAAAEVAAGQGMSLGELRRFLDL